ncbi:TonB dependent receptor protein [mine drainage metagenome]|uniref:TonB dependent receptor protein n=2 Tax=mine drainage metagenome TaxID=410659 RepID=T0ZDZ7_9ZZZZ
MLVTGSLIPTAEINTATPTITLTAKDIKAQGFTSLYQVLKAQPLATGLVGGEQQANGFTPGARPAPSLLGLSPSFTLTLIDGHPIASYPLLYSQSYNITDLNTIPLDMVSKIEIVPGNQSSIYGSAAIAGVINIILKQHAHGLDFNYQAGGYSGGGGNSQRLSLVGGYNHGRVNLIYGLQYQEQQPIWGFQRSLTQSTASNPDPELRIISPTYAIINNYNTTGIAANNVDPNSIVPNACAGLAYQFGGTTVRGITVTSAGNLNNPFQYVPNGYACGSSYLDGYSTLQNKQAITSAYASGSFRINSNTELYGNLILSMNTDNYSAGPTYNFWDTNLPYGGFINAATGTKQVAAINFSPEVTGGLLGSSTHNVGRSYSFYGGIKGSVGQSNWNYDAFYARSQYNLSQSVRQPIASKINAFFQNQFLGPQLGTSASGYPIYNPNYANFYKPITPAQYDSWLGVNNTHSESYTQNLNLNVTNTSLYQLPAGEVGVAGVLQVGDQMWHMPPNPLAAAGYFYNGSSGNGGGTRNNYAAAFEFHVPIFSMLSTDVSARFDHYHNVGGGSGSRPTYKVSFAFRPISTLLLRANYATAFRMPNMGYSFIGPGTTYYQGITDYYQCQKLFPGTSFSQCSNINSGQVNYTVRGSTVANPYLKPITAKSWGGGVVWSPTKDFNISADYYNVAIANEVQAQFIGTLLQTDAQCLENQLPVGSAACQAAYRAIQRAPNNGLVQSFGVGPVNIGKENVSGLIAALNYRYDLGRYGNLTFHGSYNVTLHHTLQLAPGQPVMHLLHNPYLDYVYSASLGGPEFKSIVSGSLTWSVGSWSTTLYGVRYGKTPNIQAYANPTVYQTYDAGRLPPWMLYNATVRYNISRDARVTFAVSNLFNTMPPFDIGQTSWPYYDNGAYNAFGRSYYIDFNYRF